MRYIKPNYMSVFCWSVFASAQTGQCHFMYNWGIFWSRMLGDLQNILRGSFVGRLNHQCPFVGIINFLYNWTSVVIRNKLRIRRILKSDQDEVFWSLEEDILPPLLTEPYKSTAGLHKASISQFGRCCPRAIGENLAAEWRKNNLWSISHPELPLQLHFWARSLWKGIQSWFWYGRAPQG